MARRRFQDPDLEQVGKWWQIRIYQDEYSNGRRIRRRKRIRLAPASMPIREVRKLKAEYLRPFNQGLISEGSATTFETYVRTVYNTTEMPLLASSTRDRYDGILKNYLIPDFGELCLRQLTPLALQKYISGFQIQGPDRDKAGAGQSAIARRGLSRESVDKIRDVLAGVLGSAVKYGYLITNPMEGVQVPPDKRGKRRHKPFIRPEQFAALIELISEPYATMVYVAVYTGLRISELIGLRWGDIHEHSITIDERYCRGDWGEPKSDASNTTIPVNRKVIERIQRLRALTVEVKAGRATRRYPVVKSDGPKRSGIPISEVGASDARQQHPGPPHQAGRQENRNPMGELAGAPAVLRHLVADGGDRSARPTVTHAAFAFHDNGRDLRARSARVATPSSREAGQSGELKAGLGQVGQAGATEVFASARKHGGQIG